MENYIAYFLIYALLGWVLEVIFNGIREGRYINCGVLNGPYCPIYGIGAVLIISILDRFKIASTGLLFSLATLAGSTVEFITGWLLEQVFGKKWWDYSNRPLNLKGYIWLGLSLIWGLIGLSLYKLIHPLIVEFVAHIPAGLLRLVISLILLTMLADIIHTAVTLVGMADKFKLAHQTTSLIGEATDKVGENLAQLSIEKAENLTKRREEIHKHRKIRQIFNKGGEQRILKAFPELLVDLEEKGYDLEEFLRRGK